MSFCNIRPFSSNAPNQSTSESTSSDAKKAVVESSSSSSKHRRVPESVTRNACVNCKRARAKCDGNKPCGRCAARVDISPCVYEVHIKHAKEELVKQIKELEAKENLTQQILQSLSADQHVSEILQRLQSGETYERIVEWLTPAGNYEAHSPTGSQRSTFEPLNHEMTGTSPTFHWTAVTLDSAILDHLFQLYFAWIHPVHTLFREGYFVKSFRLNSNLYCSSVLVNAMCALACHLHTNADSEEIERLGMNFSDAARSEIDPDDKRVTTVQALAVMFLVDCARGRGLRAASYLNIASSIVSNIEILPEEGFLDVLRDTIRGLCNLNVEWAQMTFQQPTSLRDNFPRSSDYSDEVLDEAKWYFYRYVNDSCPAWSGLVATTNREKEKLMDINRDVVTMLYNPSGPPIQARHILQQYARYIDWHKSLPKFIGDIENNNSQALPHALSLLILYSNSIVQLLRPLLGHKGMNVAGLDEIVWKHAQAGLFLLDQHYRTQYTCRYQPVFQMFAILHLCDVIARYFPGKVDSSSKDGAEAIQFGMEVLMQSYSGFPIAGTFQELLRRTALNCSVPLPKNWVELMKPARLPMPKYCADDFIDACTRLSYSQPVADIGIRFEPQFSENWDIQSPSQGFQDHGQTLRRSDAEERAAEHLMQISKLLNEN